MQFYFSAVKFYIICHEQFYFALNSFTLPWAVLLCREQFYFTVKQFYFAVSNNFAVNSFYRLKLTVKQF